MPDAPVKLPSKPTVETLEQRLDGNDKAILLLQEIANRMPTSAIVDGKVDALKELLDTKINALKELVDAKFEGNKTALDAALKTQKEASDKIEANFSKQFEAITSISQATSKATDEKISDLKDRQTTSEGRTTGLGTAGSILLGVGSLIGVAILIASFVIART